MIIMILMYAYENCVYESVVAVVVIGLVWFNMHVVSTVYGMCVWVLTLSYCYAIYTVEASTVHVTLPLQKW